MTLLFCVNWLYLVHFHDGIIRIMTIFHCHCWLLSYSLWWFCHVIAIIFHVMFILSVTYLSSHSWSDDMIWHDNAIFITFLDSVHYSGYHPEILCYLYFVLIRSITSYISMEFYYPYLCCCLAILIYVNEIFFIYMMLIFI